MTKKNILRNIHKFLFRFQSFGFMIAQRKDVQMTKILLAVVLVFLLLNLPRLILGILEISRYEMGRGEIETTDCPSTELTV